MMPLAAVVDRSNRSSELLAAAAAGAASSVLLAAAAPSSASQESSGSSWELPKMLGKYLLIEVGFWVGTCFLWERNWHV